MAITATTGKTASNATATTTLAFTATGISGSQDIVVGVALADTTKSVTGIADTAGNTFVLRSAVNGTGVRSEIWEAQSVVAHATDVITITFSGATLAAAAFEEYAGITSQSVSLFPSDFAPHNMSSNTTPAPYVVTVSSNYSGRIGANAFNGDYVGGEGSEWLGQNGGTDYLSIDLGSAVTVTGYSITVTNSDPYGSNRAPKTWTLRGSNDNFSSFTTLDTQASQTGWAVNEKRTWNVPSPGSFRYYRINITANQGIDPSYTGILELNLWGGTPSALSPQNTASGAGSDIVPRTAIAIQERANWCVAALGFACVSGDTLTATDSVLRQSIVPALTSVGIALVDFTGSTGAAALPLNVRISTARSWAAAGVELRSGSVTAAAYLDYTGYLPVAGNPLDKEQRRFGVMPPWAASPGSGGAGSGPTAHGYTY